jgi:hypothetical protein
MSRLKRNQYVAPFWTVFLLSLAFFIAGGWASALSPKNSFDFRVGQSLFITGAILLAPAVILGFCALSEAYS